MNDHFYRTKVNAIIKRIWMFFLNILGWVQTSLSVLWTSLFSLQAICLLLYFYRLKRLLFEASRSHQSQVFSKQIDISTDSDDDGLYVERIRVENMSLGFEFLPLYNLASCINGWISLTREGLCFFLATGRSSMGMHFVMHFRFLDCLLFIYCMTFQVLYAMEQDYNPRTHIW